MKKIITLIVVFCTIYQYNANAQTQINPQIGVIFQDMTSPPSGTDYKANVGYQVGVDFRIGNRFQLQPGLYYTSTNVAIDYSNPDSLLVNDDLIRSYLKINLLGAFNIINGDLLTLRAFAGPTYSYLLSVGSKDNNLDLEKGDFNSSSFSLDLGLGVDIGRVSTTFGYSYGLSDNFNGNDGMSSSSKNTAFYFNLGFVFGEGKKN